ncbi:MAG: hypothetical protein ACI9DK_000816 [Vicingaceae bacterium]|jgi:hypothetical protein
MRSTSNNPFLFLLLFFMFSCAENKWDVDLEKVKITQEFKRFESDLYSVQSGGVDSKELKNIQEQYPQFFPLYVEGIMSFGRANDPLTISVFNQYLRNKDIQEVIEKVHKTFPKASLQPEFEQLNNAFKRYHYYFPKRVVPNVITMTAAFNYATAADDSLLAIGLDMYLGGDFIVYPQIGIPKYKFQNFDKKYLVSDAMKAWLLTEFETEGGQNLMEQMVFYGKVAFLLNAFLPNETDEVFFNYSKEDIVWCEENEGPIWFHFIDMELLFNSENHQIRKYMGDAPFVAGFPEGSPGRVGQWMGYKLVKSFMENNPDVDISGLMEIQDANKILRKSNYKPQR